MGHVVIVPRRAVCSPVIEPLGFLPQPFAFSYNSLLHCIAIEPAHFVILFLRTSENFFMLDVGSV